MSDPEDEVPVRSKYKHNPIHSINQYNRKQILKILSENGSRLSTCNAILEKYSKINPKDIAVFLNRNASNAQSQVGQEANSEEFNSLNSWVEYFKNEQYDAQCGYELPLVLKAIAETEKFPNCETEDGINFKQLYYWLYDVMMGNAPIELNAQSQFFLHENFIELMEKVNDSKKERSEMENKLRSKSEITVISENAFTISIDPLELRNAVIIDPE